MRICLRNDKSLRFMFTISVKTQTLNAYKTELLKYGNLFSFLLLSTTYDEHTDLRAFPFGRNIYQTCLVTESRRVSIRILKTMTSLEFHLNLICHKRAPKHQLCNCFYFFNIFISDIQLIMFRFQR